MLTDPFFLFCFQFFLIALSPYGQLTRKVTLKWPTYFLFFVSYFFSLYLQNQPPLLSPSEHLWKRFYKGYPVLEWKIKLILISSNWTVFVPFERLSPFFWNYAFTQLKWANLKTGLRAEVASLVSEKPLSTCGRICTWVFSELLSPCYFFWEPRASYGPASVGSCPPPDPPRTSIYPGRGWRPSLSILGLSCMALFCLFWYWVWTQGFALADPLHGSFAGNPSQELQGPEMWPWQWSMKWGKGKKAPLDL
jgi:hypothetical protein